MEIVNISKSMEDVFFAKREIETYLIQEEIITEKMELNDFINYIDLSKTVYSNKIGEVMPFSIIKTNDKTYLFVTDENIDELIEALDNIEWDIDNLVEMTQEDMYFNIGLDNKFFVVNGKTMLPKKTYKPAKEITVQAFNRYAKQLTESEILDIVNNGIDSYAKKLKEEKEQEQNPQN